MGRVFRLAVIFNLFVAVAGAQEFRATLTGRVTDPQDLAITDATVQVRNISTNEVSSAKTDSRGSFTIPKLTPDWHAEQVYGTWPCVLKMDNSGKISAQAHSLKYGCGTDFSTYNFMILPNYAPRETPYRSGQIRMYSTFTMDASLNKTFALSERFKLQLRGKAFNVLNHSAFPLARFNSDPNSDKFGSLFPAQVSTVDSGMPRRLQLGAKLIL